MGTFHQDLDNLTRDLHDKSWEVEYMKKNPITAMMLERKNMQFTGGKFYTKSTDTDSHEDLTQDYSVNETLTHGVKNTTTEINFKRKYFQTPVQIDVDEELENSRQTSDGTQLQNMAAFRVRKAQEAGRFHMRELMYRSTGQAKSATDSNKFVQGLSSALTVDSTYGGRTRTFSAGTEADVGFTWQPLGGTVALTGTGGQNTEVAIGINQMRTWIDPLEDLETDNLDLVSFCGGILWLSLQAEAEARSMPYTIEKQRITKQGFTEMILDGRRIVKDPWLKAANNAKLGETTGTAKALERRFYSLNLRDWDMFIDPKRNFKMTEFMDQSKIANGSDFNLARVKFAGNLVCWHPQSQLYYSNVTE
jgi:hypothetical protein